MASSVAGVIISSSSSSRVFVSSAGHTEDGQVDVSDSLRSWLNSVEEREYNELAELREDGLRGAAGGSDSMSFKLVSPSISSGTGLFVLWVLIADMGSSSAMGVKRNPLPVASSSAVNVSEVCGVCPDLGVGGGKGVFGSTRWIPLNKPLLRIFLMFSGATGIA